MGECSGRRRKPRTKLAPQRTALALALVAALYAAQAAAALVYGRVSGIDSQNDAFQVRLGIRTITVKVNNGRYEVVLPPGQYAATYGNKRATLVSYPSSTRQDLSFK